MPEVTKQLKNFPVCNVKHSHFSPIYFQDRNIDRVFTQEAKIIIRATQHIKNPATHKKVLDFFLSALIAKYAEEKITNLIEKNIDQSLNLTFCYDR